MFENAIKIPSKINSKILLKVVPGHFATSHSHINYYMDMTRLKVGQREAKAVASTMANNYKYNTPIDAIVCMDGTYVIGAYLAEILTDAGVISMNSHQSIYVIEPEFDSPQVHDKSRVFTRLFSFCVAFRVAYLAELCTSRSDPLPEVHL